MREKLSPFECDDGEGCGVRVLAIDAGYPRVKRRLTKATRLMAEIIAFLDSEVLESLKGLREFLWNRSPEDFDEEEDADYPYEYEDSPDETLALLTNCIREDVAQGDRRAFYLTWEATVQSELGDTT